MNVWKCQCGYKNIGDDFCEKCNSPFHECRHVWDFCKCVKCSQYKDENHNWVGCKCKYCDKERHVWDDNCKCTVCGEVRHKFAFQDKNKLIEKCIKCGLTISHAKKPEEHSL